MKRIQSELTLVDLFAGLAMAGILARSGEPTAEHVAAKAYKQARAMLAQRREWETNASEKTVPGKFVEKLYMAGAIHRAAKDGRCSTAPFADDQKAVPGSFVEKLFESGAVPSTTPFADDDDDEVLP